MVETSRGIRSRELLAVGDGIRELSLAGFRPLDLFAKIVRFADKAVLLRLEDDGFQLRLSGQVIRETFPEVRGDKFGIAKHLSLDELAQTDFVVWLDRKGREASEGSDHLNDSQVFEVRGRQVLVEGVFIPLRQKDDTRIPVQVLVIIEFPQGLRA